jgi:hypothetical protein
VNETGSEFSDWVLVFRYEDGRSAPVEVRRALRAEVRL